MTAKRTTKKTVKKQAAPKTKNWSLAGPADEIAAIRRDLDAVAVRTGKLRYRVLFDAVMAYDAETDE